MFKESNFFFFLIIKHIYPWQKDQVKEKNKIKLISKSKVNIKFCIYSWLTACYFIFLICITLD